MQGVDHANGGKWIMENLGTASLTISELREFAGFTAGEQRYIKRSLDVGLGRQDAFKLWARDSEESSSIRSQYVAYQELKTLRGELPSETGFDALEAFMGKLVRITAFDLAQELDRWSVASPDASVGRNRSGTRMSSSSAPTSTPSTGFRSAGGAFGGAGASGGWTALTAMASSIASPSSGSGSSSGGSRSSGSSGGGGRSSSGGGGGGGW